MQLSIISLGYFCGKFPSSSIFMAFSFKLPPETNDTDKLVKTDQEEFGNIEYIRTSDLACIMMYRDLCNFVTFEIRANNKFSVEERHKSNAGCYIFYDIPTVKTKTGIHIAIRYPEKDPEEGIEAPR